MFYVTETKPSTQVLPILKHFSPIFLTDEPLQNLLTFYEEIISPFKIEFANGVHVYG